MNLDVFVLNRTFYEGSVHGPAGEKRAEPGGVFDIPAIIGLFVYATFGWLLVRLIWVLFRPGRQRSVRTYREVE